VALQDLVLKCGGIFFGDRFVGQDAEAGIDAVDSAAGADDPGYFVLAGEYACGSFVIEAGFELTAGNGDGFAGSEPVSAVKKNIGHTNVLGRKNIELRSVVSRENLPFPRFVYTRTLERKVQLTPPRRKKAAHATLWFVYTRPWLFYDPQINTFPFSIQKVTLFYKLNPK